MTANEAADSVLVLLKILPDKAEFHNSKFQNWY